MNRVVGLALHLNPVASADASKPFSAEELKQFTGEHGPVYLCLKGTVFDVTAGKGFYGPGGGYGARSRACVATAPD
jgi:hypothetical protein